MLLGRKWWTTRSRKYGEVGDVFKKWGATFQLMAVAREGKTTSVGVDREVRSHVRIPRAKSGQATGRAGHHGRWCDRRPDVRSLAEGIGGASVPASLTTAASGDVPI